jgi:hypothetical protein
MKTVLS